MEMCTSCLSPPSYLNRERGHIHWLGVVLPHEVTNRSLHRLAFRASTWTSQKPEYADSPVDDPERGESLLLHVAERERHELWLAPIRRSADLPSIGEWERYATDEDEVRGAISSRLRQALVRPMKPRGRTMPAANIVLTGWDVPADFYPHAEHCGPLSGARDYATSSYLAMFRPELPGPVIASQAIVFPDGYDIGDHIKGALGALNQSGSKAQVGPPLGEQVHYLEGPLGDGGCAAEPRCGATPTSSAK